MGRQTTNSHNKSLIIELRRQLAQKLQTRSLLILMIPIRKQPPLKLLTFHGTLQACQVTKTKRNPISSLSKFRHSSLVRTHLFWIQKRFSLRITNQPRPLKKSVASSSLTLLIRTKVSFETTMKTECQLFSTSSSLRASKTYRLIGLRYVSSVCSTGMAELRVLTTCVTTFITL